MSAAGKHLMVIPLVMRDDAGGAEVILRGFAGGRAHGFKFGWVGEEMDGGGTHGFYIAGLGQNAVDAIFNEFWHAADAGGDGGDAAGHSLQRGKAERFHFRRHEHEVGKREKLVDIVLLTEKMDAVLHVELAGEILGGGAVRGRRQ